MSIESLINELKSYSNKEYAAHHLRFFKTGKGEYGEGDLFYGLKVPDVRRITKKYYKNIPLNDVKQLLINPYHEFRLAALIILVLKFQKTSIEEKEDIFNLYLNNVSYINNWDLVDISAPHIVGAYLFNKNTDQLWDLARSNHLWSERISIISTLYFIKKDKYFETIDIAEFFLNHKHDLMHKATGWMLREVGKRDMKVLLDFLDKFYKQMPRTMLRYSIEKLSPELRNKYMQK